MTWQEKTKQWRAAERPKWQRYAKLNGWVNWQAMPEFVPPPELGEDGSEDIEEDRESDGSTSDLQLETESDDLSDSRLKNSRLEGFHAVVGGMLLPIARILISHLRFLALRPSNKAEQETFLSVGAELQPLIEQFLVRQFEPEFASTDETNLFYQVYRQEAHELLSELAVLLQKKAEDVKFVSNKDLEASQPVFELQFDVIEAVVMREMQRLMLGPALSCVMDPTRGGVGADSESINNS